MQKNANSTLTERYTFAISTGQNYCSAVLKKIKAVTFMDVFAKLTMACILLAAGHFGQKGKCRPG
jgi:hypothetical protein